MYTDYVYICMYLYIYIYVSILSNEMYVVSTDIYSLSTQMYILSISMYTLCLRSVMSKEAYHQQSTFYSVQSNVFSIERVLHYMNESWHTWMSMFDALLYVWCAIKDCNVVSNEMYLVSNDISWLTRVQSWHVWMSPGTHECVLTHNWVTAHANEPRHT